MSSSLLLRNGKVLRSNGDQEVSSISVRDSLIEDATPSGAEEIECEGLDLVPGFIDVHIHGAVGVDVNAGSVEGFVEVAKFLANHGVTSWVPTLVPDSDENYARVIAEIDQLMSIQQSEPIAQAIGVHYEGVFASEKMCGALRPKYFKTFSGSELAALPRLQSGVHMTTFAPEVDGGIELTRELSAGGWVASIGHTRADPKTLAAASAAGAKHVTHFFNAMTGLHHRDIGVVGWVLANEDITFDIIADGEHVHPEMLALACTIKSPDRVSLISDSVAPAGLGDGRFEIWGENVIVENGRTRNERGSIAGSVITMLDAVRRMRSLGFSPAEVSRMASVNPARLLGQDDVQGAIDVGKRADIVGLDSNGEVRLTVIGGRIAFDNR